MKNKIKVVNKFIFETIITLLPLCVSYILLGMWLSDVTDIRRVYTYIPGVTTPNEILGSPVKEALIEFDSVGPGLKSYTFEVSHVFWGVLISAILLVFIGKLIYIGLMKIWTNKAKIKL